MFIRGAVAEKSSILTTVEIMCVAAKRLGFLGNETLKVFGISLSTYGKTPTLTDNLTRRNISCSKIS